MKQPREMSRDEAAEWSDSLAHPQLEPADHCYTVLQDFGAQAGGWAPVDGHEWVTPLPPLVGAGDQLRTLAAIEETAARVATGEISFTAGAQLIFEHCKEADAEMTRKRADAVDAATFLFAYRRLRRRVPLAPVGEET